MFSFQVIFIIKIMYYNMNNKLIRLTESDLHRIVKESVKRILNEIKLGGESLHGNNAEDWAAMKYLRAKRADRASKFAGNAAFNGKQGRNFERNSNSQNDLQGWSLAAQDENGPDVKGFNKANRIDRNLNNK
jgi:hypothetical protein